MVNNVSFLRFVKSKIHSFQYQSIQSEDNLDQTSVRQTLEMSLTKVRLQKPDNPFIYIYIQ